MKIVLTCNVRPPVPTEAHLEWDDPETVRAIVRSLESLGHDVSILDCFGDGIRESLLRLRPDFVFNIAEGLFGENRESLVPELLEELRIPYTGSGPRCLTDCLNKARAKNRLKHSGIATPPWTVADRPLKTLPPELCYPVIVKPLFEGSSRGIRNDSVVRSDAALWRQTLGIRRELRQPVIVENFLTGREFTAGILGNAFDIEILPIVEIDFGSLPGGAEPLYGYEAKWIWDLPSRPLRIFTCPAKIDSALEREIRRAALDAFAALECRDWARIDLRLDSKGTVHVIELNPIPGMIPDPAANSCLPKAARAAGYSFRDVIRRVLEASLLSYETAETVASDPLPLAGSESV